MAKVLLSEGIGDYALADDSHHMFEPYDFLNSGQKYGESLASRLEVRPPRHETPDQNELGSSKPGSESHCLPTKARLSLQVE